MPRRHATRLLWAAAGVLLGVATGCGGGDAKVRGKVTYSGKPVVWGSVTLVDRTGVYHQGNIDLNGNYEIDKVPPGPVKIAVVSPKPAAGRPQEKDKGGRGAGRGAGKGGGEIEDPREKFFAGKEKEAAPERPLPPPGTWFPIPDRFASADTSGLTGEVKGTEATLDIDIK